MDLDTLEEAFPGVEPARAQRFLAGGNEALTLIGAVGANHVKRAAMFLAQIGAESVNLNYTEEIADGSAYEGRSDLGNTQPGDGVRFKGRSFIQITGRHNYGEFSAWAHSKGLVPTATYFVDHPTELGGDRWAWIGAVWYWMAARPGLNAAADAGNVEVCTQMINGGYNGLEGRRSRYIHNLTLGTRLLPEDDMLDPKDPEVVAINKKLDAINATLALFGTRLEYGDATHPHGIQEIGNQVAAIKTKVGA